MPGQRPPRVSGPHGDSGPEPWSCRLAGAVRASDREPGFGALLPAPSAGLGGSV